MLKLVEFLFHALNFNWVPTNKKGILFRELNKNENYIIFDVIYERGFQVAKVNFTKQAKIDDSVEKSKNWII